MKCRSDPRPEVETRPAIHKRFNLLIVTINHPISLQTDTPLAMSFADLVGGGACGPSNPLQSLGKRFGEDRSNQLDRFGSAGPSGSSASGSRASVSGRSRAEKSCDLTVTSLILTVSHPAIPARLLDRLDRPAPNSSPTSFLILLPDMPSIWLPSEELFQRPI